MLTLLGMVSICVGQNKVLSSIENSIAEGKSKEALKQLSLLSTTAFSPEDLGYYYFLTAKSYSKENNDVKAIENYLIAKKQYLKANVVEKAMEINLNIASLLVSYKDNTQKHQFYLKEYMDYAFSTKDNAKILKGYVQLASLKINSKEAKESLYYFRKAIVLNHKVKDKKLESKIYNNLAVLFSDVLYKPDSSLYYLRKDNLLLHQEKTLNPNYICYNLMNQASNYSQLHQYEKAIDLLLQADKIKLIEYNKVNKENINNFLYLNYKDAQNLNKALYHLEISNKYHDSLNTEQQNIAINNFDTKYKTKEKELENLELKTNIKKNKVVLYLMISVLIIVLVISILVYKNIAKKKKIAEQEKLIEIQKTEKILKDQELNDIDLMLESQEKERQNIANELHDNLGSMLATLKLNFQNLKRHNEIANQQENQLYDKTDALLEEAYQKVRNIAHLKNLGIIGSEGLLVAVNKMAEKMSVLEHLTINVIPFELTERLENTIEVALFRMIQELCTNIIKHSEATEVNIYLTQGTSKEINIIIEDNGKGFDPKMVVSKSGIGLKNMEKKVEQMGGTFTIDSILTKGTTIIIDLPL
ncbi:sensor histidine kinase [[Flexibacter] sp. ATCC 35103]|uniref:sensor histidine kinase n=1 Tax=[Flexibacter] sp. ATCC 35103 TaxID=1937528 RepID=UPI0013F5BF52|nr:sensor histidine kinase [[Flexibacter] sp. ATCC 35103]